MGELRKESGSKAGGWEGGGWGGEGEERGEGEEVEVTGGGGEQEDGVRSRPLITGDGRRVRESVATPEGGGGTGVEEEGGAGEEGLLAGGGGRAGDSNSCPEWVSDILRPGPASSPLAPPPPARVEVVAMTMTAFWGSATVVRLVRRLYRPLPWLPMVMVALWGCGGEEAEL